MEVVSDTIDANGKRHLVVKYTEEEKEAMRLRKEQHDKELQEKFKIRPNANQAQPKKAAKSTTKKATKKKKKSK